MDCTMPSETPLGWKCPGCGACYSPHVEKCSTCGPCIRCSKCSYTASYLINGMCQPCWVLSLGSTSAGAPAP